MIRNMIFDWSGTLVDDLPAVWSATNHVLTPAGLIMRALGRNPFAASGSGTNWAAYLERRRNRSHYEHAFSSRANSRPRGAA